eukprot:452834-Alexandrium_andersonii.AAC.1
MVGSLLKSKGMTLGEKAWWSELERERFKGRIRETQGLLRLAGVWQECQGETGGTREVRERVRRHGMGSGVVDEAAALARH